MEQKKRKWGEKLSVYAPKLAGEWHPTLNAPLTPDDVSYKNQKAVWWRCEKGHEWRAMIKYRTLRGDGCPHCTGKHRIKGKSDLATTHPALASEWHPTRNLPLTPDTVSYKSEKSVWWRCEKGHEWHAMIKHRTMRQDSCPYCSEKYVTAGKTDLATTHPELAAEWHPTKNTPLTPDIVSARSKKNVWWRCEKGHEWRSLIKHRSMRDYGCPYCSGRNAIPGETDLATINPVLAEEWHPTKNGETLPTSVKANSAYMAWWLGKCGHEWQAKVSSRNKGGYGCPYCANHKLLKGFNDLATIAPEAASEWHPTKNGDLTPDSVLAYTHKEAVWLGKCGHEWTVSVRNRAKGSGCPYCARKRSKTSTK